MCPSRLSTWVQLVRRDRATIGNYSHLEVVEKGPGWVKARPDEFLILIFGDSVRKLSVLAQKLLVGSNVVNVARENGRVKPHKKIIILSRMNEQTLKREHG
jgi:hypothetical protein